MDMIATTIATAVLVINELMASNIGMAYSPATNFDSWIELYNPGDEAVSLKGMTLTDHHGNGWQLPASLGSVEPGGFKVLWMGSNDIRSDQAPFKLDCDGGSITLCDANGNVVTAQDYPEAMSRTAWARMTDGGEEWGWTATVTPGSSNATATFASQRLAAPVVNMDSKLFRTTLDVKVEIPEGARLMYTTDGSLPTGPAEAVELPWVEQVKNGDCEGTATTNILYKNGESSNYVRKLTDGIGYNDSRGIKVHAVGNATKASQTQFYVNTPNYTWKTNDRFRFRMKVRADKAARITAIAQKKYGENIGNGVSMLAGSYEVTTEWTEICFEGTLTAEQAGEEQAWGGWWGWNETTYSLKTIAFNLNMDLKLENNYYFDDISWESLPDGYVEESSKESTDGVFTIASTTVLTLRLFRDGYLPSVPVTRSFIKTSNKYTLPVISIVGNKSFFTDPVTGFDCDGDGTNGKTGNGQNSPRNYNQPWDRPVTFTYMTPEGESLCQQDVNIKVSGGWTRSQRFRSFKLKASKAFEGQNHYDYSFFPQKPYIRSKTLLVRNGGNDVWVHNARFMDPALETIIQRSGIDLDVQSYVPVIEYVNGELRGVLNLREPNNDDFAYANFGYDDDELDAFENMVMKNGNDSVLNRIFELSRHINDEGAYDELVTLLDIDEFTNYMAVTMFLDNDDWPNNNMKAYRSRHDGRYRFVSFDLDYAFTLRNFNKDNDDPFKYFVRFKDAATVYDEENRNREIVRLFLNLMAHDGYRRKFIDTFCIVGGSVFEPTCAGRIVDELLSDIKPMCQMMKQQGITDGHDPDRAASTIKTKLNGRSKKMAGHLKTFSYAKLDKAAQSVRLTADVEGAHLYVNGIDVPYAAFNGHLFAPVELTAKAPAGYYFVGWENGSELYPEETISLPEGSTVKLNARFAPLSEDAAKEQGITPVRVNEVSAANAIYVNDQWKRNDWVELYNTTDEDIDVAGMYLSDNPDKPRKWQITNDGSSASTIVPARGYLIVWCDKLTAVSQLHATFKLAAEGGDVLLTAEDESWTDHLTYAQMKEDETVGRYPDGAAQVYRMNVPSIAKTNVRSSYAESLEQPVLSGIRDMAQWQGLSARYTVGHLVVTGQADSQFDVVVSNTVGQLIRRVSITTDGYGRANLPLTQLPKGIYVAHVSSKENAAAVSCKFVKK